MKNPKNTVWRIALFLLTVVCGLLMADRGENEFPVFACSEALSGESGSTGLLLQQNMWEVVPLLGYGIVEQQGTQNPEEDETTCRTLTTEDLISEELLLPQPEETQQTALIKRNWNTCLMNIPNCCRKQIFLQRKLVIKSRRSDVLLHMDMHITMTSKTIEAANI